MGQRQQLCTQLAPLAFRSVVEGSCKVGWKPRVWFPNGQSATLLEHIGLSLSLSWLIRRLFPRLDRLEGQNFQWLEDLAEAKFGPFGGSRFPMATLILSDRDNSQMDFLIARMVFIVRLVLGTIGAKVLDVLSRRFRPPPLVYTRFNLNDQCSAELCHFFATCSHLKECLGNGHLVLPEVIIISPRGLLWNWRSWTLRFKCRRT